MRSPLATVLDVAVEPYALHKPPQFLCRAAVCCDGLRERGAEIRQEVRGIVCNRSMISNDLPYLAR